MKIINTHDQLVAAGGGVAITRAYTPSRERRVCGWAVYRVNAAGEKLATDPKAAWYDHGCKTFLKFGRGDALADAKEWVAETYGEGGPWKRNSWGDYVAAPIAKAFPLAQRKRSRE